MDYQQMSEALAGLCELSIKFREAQWRIGRAEPWYVSQNIVVKKAGASTVVGKGGNGNTPQDAIVDHWRTLVDDLSHDEYLIVGSGDSRRAVKWNGFMWADYPEPARVAA